MRGQTYWKLRTLFARLSLMNSEPGPGPGLGLGLAWPGPARALPLLPYKSLWWGVINATWLPIWSSLRKKPKTKENHWENLGTTLMPGQHLRRAATPTHVADGREALWSGGVGQQPVQRTNAGCWMLLNACPCRPYSTGCPDKTRSAAWQHAA